MTPQFFRRLGKPWLGYIRSNSLFFNSSFIFTKDGRPASLSSAASHSESISFIRLSIFARYLSHFFLVHVFLVEALARILVPSTNKVLPSIKSSLTQSRAHCLRTIFEADLLFLLNSAMVYRDLASVRKSL